MLLDFCPAATVQGALSDRPDSAHSKALMAAVDGFNRRYGRDADLGELGQEIRLEAAQRHALTTQWEDVLTVR